MQINRKLWKNCTKVNFITVINQGAPSPVWKSSKKRRGATMSCLLSKVYKGRSRGEISGREQGEKHGGGRRGTSGLGGRGHRSICRRGHGRNIAEADVEMSESQRLEELRKTQEQGLQVKSFFILQIFISAGRKSYFYLDYLT